jgi:hypothetical protein
MNNFAVITRPGYGHGNILTVASTHKTIEAAHRKAASWKGYMVVPTAICNEPRKGGTVYADAALNAEIA